jgi:hypothetical protein
MNHIIRNILAVIAGILIGAIVNMGLITLSPMVIPPPGGVDVTNSESLAANIHLFEFKHFIFPFLAHALGTLAGAFVAFKLAHNRPGLLALIIGVFFLMGGIASATMIPAPTWFIALDILVAYIPMSWLAIKLSQK